MMSKHKMANEPASPKRPAWLLPALVVGGLVALLAIVAAFTAGRREPFMPEVTGAPRAEVDVTRVDHGAVAFNQPVESVYRVRNVGDQPLRILGEPRVELVEGC